MYSTKYNEQFTLSDELKREDLASIVAEVIMNEYEPVLLEKSVKARYGYLEREERRQITANAKAVAKSEEEGEIPTFSARRERVRGKITEYLKSTDAVVPCGFIDFRMREMYYWAEKIAEKGADLFFEKKEYEEFTYLLSIFVAEKETLEEVIHLLWTNEGIKLLNKRGRNVTKKYEKDFFEVGREKNVSEEDLAISAIIAAAPKKLVIHNPPKNSPLAQTLMKIFEGRSVVCSGCGMCKKEF